MSQPPASPSPPMPPEQPPYYAPAPPEPSKTISILALVFGGAALLFGLIPVAGIFLGGLFGIAAIVLGIIGIFISHRLFAIIGIALAVLGLIVAIIITIAVGKSAEEFIEDWPSESEESEDKPKDEVVDGTDPTAPLPAGTEITTGNWTVLISDVVPDATEEVMAADEFNVAPAEGFQFFMFHVEATYQGEASSTAWVDLLLGVYIDSTVYTEACGFIPDHLSVAPEVFAGGTAAGDFCLAVPTAGVENAAISVEDYWTGGQRFFISAS